MNTTPSHQLAFDRLIDIMRQLRDPTTGCAWDLEQSFRTIAPYTIEEAYEVSDAIDRNDMVALCDELGDLLLQVVFHAQMASEQQSFTIDDVITAICDKMERRHPHIFGDDMRQRSADEQIAAWEEMKATERQQDALPGALDGVALSLPALLRAEKLQRRAARVGFDWPDHHGPRAKIIEELAEVDAASTDADRQEEIGDLLFSVVNYARHVGVEPELALRQANAKFERRFRTMEDLTTKAVQSQTPDELEALWQRAKIKTTNAY